MLLLIAAALQATAPLPSPSPAPESPIVTTASGLRFQVLAPGTGRRPTRADAVQIMYEVRLADGTLVESTTEPAGVPVSGSIRGFTEALLLMNQGGRYRFWVPARLAYGRRGNPGAVPPDADLVFTLTLLRVGRAAQPPRPR